MFGERRDMGVFHNLIVAYDTVGVVVGLVGLHGRVERSDLGGGETLLVVAGGGGVTGMGLVGHCCWLCR